MVNGILTPSRVDPSAGSGKPSAELANLDFLRAVAVGIVLLTHILMSMRVRGASKAGHFGVLLFFVHTSLVLMMSMERLNLSGRDMYTAFMVRRIFRIYPLSILSVLAVVCFRIPRIAWGGDYVWAGWQTFVSNLLLTQNLTQSPSLNCVLWSLPFEVQMYTLLPLLFLWARRLPSLLAMAGAWLAAVGPATAEYLLRSGTTSHYFLVARYSPCFVSGLIAWRLMKIRRPWLPSQLWVVFLFVTVILYGAVDVVRLYGPASLGLLHGVYKGDDRIWWPLYLDLVNDWFFCAAVRLFTFISVQNMMVPPCEKTAALRAPLS